MNTIQTTLDKAIRYHQDGRLDKAESLYRKIVREDRRNADAWHLLGVLFYQMGELEIAENNIKKAIEYNPNVPSFYSNLGLVFHQKTEYGNAVTSYRKALALMPDYPEALNNLGNALRNIGIKGSEEHTEALACYQKALQLAPSYAEAMNNLANLLGDYGKMQEAAIYYEAALNVNPQYKETYINLGIHQYRQEMYAQSAANLKTALTLPGDVNPLALNTLFECKKAMCEWEGIGALEKRLIEKALDERDSTLIDPFVVVEKMTEVTKEQQFQLIRKYNRNHITKGHQFSPVHHKKQAGGKLRLGYISADLFNHATMHLIQRLFALHDRSRFDVTLFALYKDETSPYYQQVEAGVDRLVDLTSVNDETAAEIIRNEGIDILIDLNGLTKNARTAIFAYRPAPVQMQYLAFPGTMANDWTDYIITDEIITPEADNRYFGETFLYMPNCYQVNDGKQEIAATFPSRSACGLPEDAFVFCSFNQPYKIEPMIFGVWMEVLHACENSVLWLLSANREAEANLKNEAQQRGIDPERLIFAPKLPKADHLARLKHADLVLDTYYCNAHTTASDALYAGVPLLTCKGDRMASRVAASILNAVGLGECITTTLDRYKETAIDLATENERLTLLRKKLEKNKTTAPLFDTERFAKELETGLTMAWKNYLEGKEPQTLRVEQEVRS